MIARSLISKLIPPLKDTDNGIKALSWMGEFHLQSFPVVSGKELVGMVSEYDILDMDNPENQLSTLQLDANIERMQEFDLIYDVVKKMYESKMGSIAVLDAEDEYIGLITSETVMQYFASTNAFQDPGGVLILQMKSRDYSMVEISQIIETNHAVILESHIAVNPKDHEKLTVTIKVNKLQMEAIVATFERYKYTVKAVQHETEDTEMLQDRLDGLLNYLDI